MVEVCQLQHHTNFTSKVPNYFIMEDFNTIRLEWYDTLEDLIKSVDDDRHDIPNKNVRADIETRDYFLRIKREQKEGAELLR